MSAGPLAVLGAGAWGTALAIHVARLGHQVRLWGHEKSHVDTLNANRENKQFLPGVPFPDTLSVHNDLTTVLTGAKAILMVVPSDVFGNVLAQVAHAGFAHLPIISASKGLDPTTGDLLHTVVAQHCPKAPFAVLSGPSFAKEVAQDKPTAVSVAVKDAALSAAIKDWFHGRAFRVYTSEDFVGVQLGGAMKNPLAIAVGISDGLGFGANARSALITRGLAELTRLGVALGGKAQTLTGLSGLGDLVLTCTDNQSRNRRFGLLLADGLGQDKARETIGQVVEGAKNVAKINALAARHKIELPICEQIYAVLHEDMSPQDAVSTLLARAQRSEK